MLSAAVSGQVFASPNAGQVEKAIGKLSMSKGVLLVVKVRRRSFSRGKRRLILRRFLLCGFFNSLDSYA